MATKVFTDFHHSSLLRATNLLFGDRLGMEVYRPIGMAWFDEGFWAINNQSDTARQYLERDSQPGDGTPPLNEQTEVVDGVYFFEDPGGSSHHRACTLDFFKHNQFDYVIASIPAHVPLFELLVAKYQPNAKLIVQIGNEWPPELFAGHNVLASVKPRKFPHPDTNAFFYHQEFDLSIFHTSPVEQSRNIYSFINILQNIQQGWEDFKSLEMLLGARGYTFKSFGGQCRDGNMNGPDELADMMRHASMIFHVKDGGDGFGHILYNAYAVGRPIITRSSFYKNRLGEELLVPGTFIDLDEDNLPTAFRKIEELHQHPDALEEMGAAAAERFQEVVHYEREAEGIQLWLRAL